MSRHKIRHSTVTRHVTIEDGGEQPTHYCLAGQLCRGADTGEDGTRHPAITDKPDSVCRRCFSAIRIAVEDLPRDHTDLLAAIGDHQHIPGEKVHASQGYTAPIDTTKHDLAGEITRQLRAAAHRVHTARGTEGDPPRTPVDCSQLVRNHLDLLITSGKQLEEDWCGAGESVLTHTNGKPHYIPNIRIAERRGIDTAMRLVDLRRRARARLAGVSTDMWRLPSHFPGCVECGEQLYTNGHKIVCRACNRDWTTQNGGLFNAEIKRQAEAERQQRMDEYAWYLAETTWQRDTAHERLDKIALLAEAIYQPDYNQVTTHQFAQLLTDILDGHPTPEQRQPAVE